MIVDIVKDFLIHLWPIVVGAIVGLIVWNIQFFRNYKRDKDTEFRTWLQAQEQNWQKHFNDFTQRSKDEWETAQEAIERYHKLCEDRLTKIERERGIKGNSEGAE